MQKKYEKLGRNDLQEAHRFDKIASESYKGDADLLIEPIHWEKFNTDKSIPHPYAYIVQSLGDLKDKHVLEIGCGTGIFSVILCKRGAQNVESFDISDKSIKIAARRAKINDVESYINFRTMSIYDMNYRENTFDLMVGLNILHHIEIERVIKKIYHQLKSGGVAYFNEPFGDVRWLERLRLLIPVKVNEEDKSHWQEQLTYKDIQRFTICFKKVKCKEFHLLSRLERVIKSRYLLRLLAITDAWLLLNFPILRKFARRVVIILKK